jgi:hypothetical protein
MKSNKHFPAEDAADDSNRDLVKKSSRKVNSFNIQNKDLQQAEEMAVPAAVHSRAKRAVCLLLCTCYAVTV